MSSGYGSWQDLIETEQDDREKDNKEREKMICGGRERERENNKMVFNFKLELQ